MPRPADGWLFTFTHGCGRLWLWFNGCGAGWLWKSPAVKTSSPCIFCKGRFEASEGPSQARGGTFKAREGLFKNKVGKHRLVFVFGRGPFD